MQKFLTELTSDSMVREAIHKKMSKADVRQAQRLIDEQYKLGIKIGRERERRVIEQETIKKNAADFQIGDWVYADDWCYGQIVTMDGDSASVEFETAGGGGSFSFDLCELRHAPEPN